jgi:hypothetical protein
LCTSIATSRAEIKDDDANPTILPSASTVYPSVTKGRLPSSAASATFAARKLKQLRRNNRDPHLKWHRFLLPTDELEHASPASSGRAMPRHLVGAWMA